MIEYIFGRMKRKGKYVEIAKTISDDSHTNLLGFCQVIKNSPDSTITDNFRIIEKFQSDNEGGRYTDWYEIDSHTTEKDYFRPAQPEINQGIADAQDATCELSESTEESIASLEQAICDLSEEIFGGNE